MKLVLASSTIIAGKRALQNLGDAHKLCTFLAMPLADSMTNACCPFPLALSMKALNLRPSMGLLRLTWVLIALARALLGLTFAPALAFLA